MAVFRHFRGPFAEGLLERARSRVVEDRTFHEFHPASTLKGPRNGGFAQVLAISGSVELVEGEITREPIP